MAKTRSMTKNQSYAEDEKRVVAPWSDLNHDLLFSVMMRLGVVDFVAFSGVCKSWRSLALCNKKIFMASRPPMSMRISSEANKKDYCNLKDFEGRKFKTLLPHSTGRIFVGLTCGYLILFEKETKDFWLVNPITRHQIHFPNLPDDHGSTLIYEIMSVILVFSPSMSRWLLVMTKRYSKKIWFSIAGKEKWNHVSTISLILDLHAFKGKIYTLNIDYVRGQSVRHLCEMRFDPEPKLKVLETKNFPKMYRFPQFASYGENLYVVQYMSPVFCEFHKLDFDEMKWVDPEETREDEFEIYRNHMGHITAVKQDLWAGTHKSGNYRFNTAHLWYFPHDCLNVNHIDG